MSQKIYTKLQQVRKRYSAKELRTIHHQTLAAVAELKGSEAKVILKLQDCDRLLVHRFIGYNSLFSYAVKALELTEHQALAYINVARKAAEIPELHEAIQKGEVTVSKARRVTAVIDNDNKEKWIGLLKTSTKQVIEKAVAEVSPRAVHHEQVRRLTKDLLELRTPLTEGAAKNLTRVQDLLAQAKQRHVSREEAISEALALFIERMDPVRKAERAMARADKAKNRAERSMARADKANTRAERVMKLDEQKEKQAKRVMKRDEQNGRQAEKTNELGLGRVTTCQVAEAHVHDRSAGLKNELGPGHALRAPLKGAQKNALMLASHACCQERLPDGSLCDERRWLEVHHLIPVAQGGANAPENLVILCRAHHQISHVHQICAPDAPSGSRSGAQG